MELGCNDRNVVVSSLKKAEELRQIGQDIETAIWLSIIAMQRT
jgi:hypothetical protein